MCCFCNERGVQSVKMAKKESGQIWNFTSAFCIRHYIVNIRDFKIYKTQRKRVNATNPRHRWFRGKFGVFVIVINRKRENARNVYKPDFFFRGQTSNRGFTVSNEFLLRITAAKVSN